MSTPARRQPAVALAESSAEREAIDVARDVVLAQMLEDERVEGAEVDGRLLWRLLAYLRPHRRLVIATALLAISEAVLMTLPAWAIGMAVDSAAGNASAANRSFAVASGPYEAVTGTDLLSAGGEQIFIYFGIVVGVLWTLRFVVGSSASYLVGMLGQRVVHDLRRDVYNHISGMDMGFFHANPVGRLVNRATFDVQALAELFSDALSEGIRDTLFVIVLLILMFALDPPLALILLSAFPVLIAVGMAYRALARPALRTMSAVQSRMNAWTAENLAGMRENHLYRREERRAAEYELLTQALQKSVRRVIQAWGFVRPGLMLTCGIATAVVLHVGYDRVLSGAITVGILLTFLQNTTRLWVPIRNLAEKLNLIQTSLTSGERISDILDTKTAMRDRADADRSLNVVSGAIAYRDVEFRYRPDGTAILRGVSFEAEPGQMVALVGDTGAGKSTVVHLLSRFYDVTAGSIEVDGRDVRDFTLNALRRGMALVPQDVVIFAGSLRENITLGAKVSDAVIWDALNAVCAGDLVRSLPGGLDASMTEGGRALSAGQRQLLSFARALVANPPILVLDEATANVDSETEAQIQLAIDRITVGRTSVVIAHRLSTIQRADLILVLRHGEVIERGTHATLLAQGGEYARLHAVHMGADGHESGR